MGRRCKRNKSEDLPEQKILSKLSGKKAENDKCKFIVLKIPSFEGLKFIIY
jgi:hypothetical protein